MINLKLDTATLRRTTNETIKRLRAMRTTVERAGAGEVLVSRRRKIAGEKGRAIHGRAIANMLADRGKDPFDYDRAVLESTARTVATGTAHAIQQAWKTGLAQQGDIRELFTAAAQDLADWAHSHLVAGGLGGVAASTRRRKLKLARQGLIEHGAVDILGIRSGQFVAGFRARFRAGRRTS